ncbi:MAG: hypothetical protein JNJ83_04890 [Verrucomicrobiaceae bacterium]|nr:hypothetical protein [Verrucomicrobiaceae bacterium]
MARPSNTFESHTMTIAVSPQIKVYLEDLTKLGTFGCSPQEALRQVVNNAIQAMVKDGTLAKREFDIKNGQVQIL